MSAVPSTAPWLDEIRAAAQAAFVEADVPSDEDEVWRYSRIGDVDLSRYALASEVPGAPEPVLIEGAAATVTIRNGVAEIERGDSLGTCLLYTSPSPRDRTRSRMPSSA